MKKKKNQTERKREKAKDTPLYYNPNAKISSKTLFLGEIIAEASKIFRKKQK